MGNNSDDDFMSSEKNHGGGENVDSSKKSSTIKQRLRSSVRRLKIKGYTRKTKLTNQPVKFTTRIRNRYPQRCLQFDEEPNRCTKTFIQGVRFWSIDWFQYQRDTIYNRPFGCR